MAGRPREFDRAQALAKARDLFWTRGYEGVSMADLVAALGIASARIYAAFGSKEQLFREAVELYETGEGAFAVHALAARLNVRNALVRMLEEAVLLYTRSGQPQGCMVVTAATNTSAENAGIADWLAQHRRARTQSLIERLRDAQAKGELREDADVQALGDYYAALLHGLSVQARDGIAAARLLALIVPAMAPLDLALA
ncbi:MULTISPECIES: TetR/AcrR family transcriptional regulator [unclassified Janthinobacterium]|uniref:TetR/AcrR family transcriptional regulator n=1 Tax=unclassified Janthinobacterium TaxID=2610881 RepID=UPI00160EE8BA|nr:MULTISPECIES: TetR/AcrR family transcriptional regulator [unclassified Janthinobacterium]MBB5366797.1 AcrR family transcriptional regulator [Janthinobacterium sp. K2C7]MBB5380725.1 AcrR family transcriptional regulator [Janthinobacterium sp. K2Li3]MBB5385179.1 AcrR family transcriptional regulator [Janthinobacterium sp. K2E3]